MRFFLLDRVVELVPQSSVHAIKAWTLSEDYFTQHFPGFPIVPGVLLTESMAQATGLLLEKSHQARFGAQQEAVFAILSIVHRAKFKGFVRPGDQAVVKATMESLDVNSGAGHAKVFVDGEMRAEAEMLFRLFPESLAGANLSRLREYRAEYHSILMQPADGKLL